MQTIERIPAGYRFCGETIGRTIAEAIEFVEWLGAGPAETIEVRRPRRRRPLLRGALADVADLAGVDA